MNIFRHIAVYLLLLVATTGFAEEVQKLPQIVAFLGQKRVGKDTSADFLVQTYGYKKYALADPMKKAAQSLFHFSDEQLWGNEKDTIDPYWQVTPRQIMQYMGIDTLYEGLGVRFPHLGNSFFIRAFERYRNSHPDEIFVISDLRMQQDVDALKEMGALIIRLERPGVVTTDTHISETAVASVEGYDCIIVNDTTVEALEQKITREIIQYASK